MKTAYKTIAVELGYEVFYDKSLKLWTFIHPKNETEYFTKTTLEIMSIAQFEQYLVRQFN